MVLCHRQIFPLLLASFSRFSSFSALTFRSKALSWGMQPKAWNGMPFAVWAADVHNVSFPKKANHPKGWDAKPLAYVQRLLDMAAGLPGAHSTSNGLCRSHGSVESHISGGAQ